MIIHRKNSLDRLLDFGIQIPLLSSRSEMILKDLKVRLGPEKLKHKLLEFQGERLKRADLLLAHDEPYVERLLAGDEEAVIEAYELRNEEGNWHRYAPEKAARKLSEIIDEHLKEAEISCVAAEKALENGFTYFLGGGMHHAASDRGRGFCLINDVVLCIRKLLYSKKISTAWVIDVDAHKGDGTASLLTGDDRVKTLSIHMADSWPLDDTTCSVANAQSDLDIGMRSGEEGLYLKRLMAAVDAWDQQFSKPDFVVVVNGSDPYEKDVLPSTQSLQLNLEVLLERDAYLFDFFRGKSIPQLWLMAGGYGPEVFQVHSQFLEYALQTELSKMHN